MQPLRGLVVVSLEHAIAAPLATRQLADLGARVIKVERPGEGDFARGYDRRVRGLSSHFVWTNRSKESLTLDLRQPAARALLEQLVLEKADVLVQNLAPGAAARLGFGHPAWRAKKPTLILCDISGYGDDPDRPGPYRDKKAYDLLIQAEAGLVSVTGSAETPSKAGISMADIAAGMHAHASILSALIERGRTGLGTRIDISMFEALADWMGFPLYYAFEGAEPPPRRGASHATIFPYGPFPVGDGTTVLFGLQNEREWTSFCTTVLRLPELAADPRYAGNAHRVEHREALQRVIVETFAALDGAEVVSRLDAAQIANARVNELPAVWKHAQLVARDRWRSVGSPVGDLPALLPPGAEADVRLGPIPAVGQHTDAILAELGLDAAAIAALRASGVV